MIRLAEAKDMDRLLEIYAIARGFMAETGNGGQWGDNYPPRKLIEEDIEAQRLYVNTEEQDGAIHGVFMFSLGDDPTYDYIEGAWKKDGPYGVIHRVASDGSRKGLFNDCLAYCKDRTDNIRIDTHEQNLVMQHVLSKNGFKKCGVIYVRDNSPRLAYQYVAGELHT